MVAERDAAHHRFEPVLGAESGSGHGHASRAEQSRKVLKARAHRGRFRGPLEQDGDVLRGVTAGDRVPAHDRIVEQFGHLVERGGALRVLCGEGIRSRVVSMPSWDIFDHQPQEYRDEVLPPRVTARLAIEQASTFGWEHYTGLGGLIVGMKTFGASAPLKELQRKFGFEPNRVVAAAKQLLQKA